MVADQTNQQDDSRSDKPAGQQLIRQTSRTVLDRTHHVSRSDTQTKWQHIKQTNCMVRVHSRMVSDQTNQRHGNHILVYVYPVFLLFYPSFYPSICLSSLLFVSFLQSVSRSLAVSLSFCYICLSTLLFVSFLLSVSTVYPQLSLYPSVIYVSLSFYSLCLSFYLYLYPSICYFFYLYL